MCQSCLSSFSWPWTFRCSPISNFTNFWLIWLLHIKTVATLSYAKKNMKMSNWLEPTATIWGDIVTHSDPHQLWNCTSILKVVNFMRICTMWGTCTIFFFHFCIFFLKEGPSKFNQWGVSRLYENTWMTSYALATNSANVKQSRISMRLSCLNPHLHSCSAVKC